METQTVKILKPAERVIVALDFEPKSGHPFVPYDGKPNTLRKHVRSQLINFAKKLKGTGVVVKINSPLKACGYDLIDELHDMGLSVFADLKLVDISKTLEYDGQFLAEAKPEFVTVMCNAYVDGISALKKALPKTEVLGVTVLTTHKDDSAIRMYGQGVNQSVMVFAKIAQEGGADGLICSPKEAGMIREKLLGRRLTVNTPNTRPEWAKVVGDDQAKERQMTPFEAFKAGVDRIVIGRPITQDKDPYRATMRTIEEVALAFA